MLSQEPDTLPLPCSLAQSLQGDEHQSESWPVKVSHAKPSGLFMAMVWSSMAVRRQECTPCMKL